jgi:hypothetical protein
MLHFTQNSTTTEYSSYDGSDCQFDKTDHHFDDPAFPTVDSVSPCLPSQNPRSRPSRRRKRPSHPDSGRTKPKPYERRHTGVSAACVKSTAPVMRPQTPYPPSTLHEGQPLNFMAPSHSQGFGDLPSTSSTIAGALGDESPFLSLPYTTTQRNRHPNTFTLTQFGGLESGYDSIPAATYLPGNFGGGRDSHFHYNIPQNSDLLQAASHYTSDQPLSYPRSTHDDLYLPILHHVPSEPLQIPHSRTYYKRRPASFDPQDGSNFPNQSSTVGLQNISFPGVDEHRQVEQYGPPVNFGSGGPY